MNQIFKGKTILIVEDDLFSFQILELMLEETGAEIILITDGNQSVEICKSNPNINLVLMDINLPELDGLKATQEILKNNPNIPIISQTANAMYNDKQKSLDAGCIDYITKPIIAKKLLQKIIKHIL